MPLQVPHQLQLHSGSQLQTQEPRTEAVNHQVKQENSWAGTRTSNRIRIFHRTKEISVRYSTVRCLRMPVSIILTRETYKSSVHQDKNQTVTAWLAEKNSYAMWHWKKHSMIWLAQCNRPRLWKKSHSYHQQHSALSSTPVSFRQAIQTVFVKMKRNSNRHVSTWSHEASKGKFQGYD